MHTKVFKEGKPGDEPDVRIHHNGDWSGEAFLQWHGNKKYLGFGDGLREATLSIPGWVAEELCRPLQEDD